MRLAFLTYNIGWKLLALALALLLWLALISSREASAAISVPVEYHNMPPDLELSSDVLEKVMIEIRGPEAQLEGGRLSELVVLLDLREVRRPGERTFSIRSGDVRLPRGVALARAVPSQVRLHFERRLSREVAVQARIATPPPPGYGVERIEVAPSLLRIVGPESRVNRASYVPTDGLDLGSVVDRGEFTVNAYLPDPHIRFESGSQVVVRVQVRKVEPKGN